MTRYGGSTLQPDPAHPRYKVSVLRDQFPRKIMPYSRGVYRGNENVLVSADYKSIPMPVKPTVENEPTSMQYTTNKYTEEKKSKTQKGDSSIAWTYNKELKNSIIMLVKITWKTLKMYYTH